ncbi:MAG: hypothetical protein ACYC7G_06450 [Rudaea sp.]
MHLVEFVVEIAEHETDQILGLLLAAFGGLSRDHGLALGDHRGIAREQRIYGQHDRHRHDRERDRSERRQFPDLAALLALLERIETDAEHACDQFQFGVGLAILAFARVGSDRFGAFVRQLTVRVELEAQGGTEAFLGGAAGQVGGIGLAIHDQAEDALAAAHALVRAHFFVDPA